MFLKVARTVLIRIDDDAFDLKKVFLMCAECVPNVFLILIRIDDDALDLNKVFLMLIRCS